MNGFDLALALRRMTGRELAKKIGEPETVTSKLRTGERVATPKERAVIAKALDLPEAVVFGDADFVQRLIDKLTDTLRLEVAARVFESQRGELAKPLRR
jgi:hypothetical protein